MLDYTTYFPEPVEALYLDDLRPLPADTHFFHWVLVKSYEEFTAYIRQRGMPAFISFDHDLSLEHYADPDNWGDKYNDWQATQDFKEKTGFEAAKWLVDYCLDNDILMPHFSVHSANPAGAENILHLLNNLQQEQGTEPNGYRTHW